MAITIHNNYPTIHPSSTLAYLRRSSSSPRSSLLLCTLSTMNSVWAALAVLLVVGVVPRFTTAADEDPLQDFCVADPQAAVTINGVTCKPAAQVTVDDFKTDVLKNRGNTANANNAVVTAANVFNFGGLNTFGISAVRIDYAKGGINPPHIHPRATEILFVLEGELYVGFVSSNGTVNTLFATYLKKGDLFVFPRGLVHFQLNVGKGDAFAFGALSSQNPGVQQIAPALFQPDIKDEVLEKGFRIDRWIVDKIQAKFRP